MGSLKRRNRDGSSKVLDSDSDRCARRNRVGGTESDPLRFKGCDIRDSEGHMGAPNGGRSNRDPAQRDPTDSRRKRHPRSQESGRCTTDLRTDSDDARSELSAVVRVGVQISVCLYCPCERADDHPGRTVSRDSVGPPSMASAGTLEAAAVATRQGIDLSWIKEAITLGLKCAGARGAKFLDMRLGSFGVLRRTNRVKYTLERLRRDPGA